MEKARKTVLEMLDDRNYTIKKIEDDSIIAFTPENIKMIVFFSIFPKLNIDSIKEYIKQMDEMNISHSMIIYQNAITSSAKTTKENLFNIKIELFSIEELEVNITKHRLVPKHSKVDDKEKIFKQYGNKFPIIFTKDPISRYYDFRKGDLIKVIRKGGHIAYRIVK